MEKKGNPVLIISVALAAVVAIAVPFFTLFDVGSYLWCNVRVPETHGEWLEIALLSVVSAVIFFGIRNIRLMAAALFGVTCIFCYVHVDLLPFLVSGLYMAGILFCGGFVRGCSLIIVSECLLSLLKIGTPFYLRIFTASLFAGLLFYRFLRHEISIPENVRRLRFSGAESLVLAVIFVVFLVQAGRLNGTIDFDSLWYGLRSDRILAPGEGIYEDLGLLGMVYTYSKGFEVLGLPLSGFRSYSYILFFNVWIFLYGLYRTFLLGRKTAGKGAGLLAALLTALVPGIVNMSVSAKPDIITWALQIVMLDEFFSFVKREKDASFLKVAAACFLSYAMKPTAVVFSSALFGMMLVYAAVRGIREKIPFSRLTGFSGNDLFTGILSVLALCGIWGRTILLTGLPFTSVFSGVLTGLGFSLKYPFGQKTLPRNFQDRSPFSVLLDRLYHMLLSPKGTDMSQVAIAWGGSLFFVILCAILVTAGMYLLRKKKKGTGEQTESKEMLTAALVVFLPYLLVNLIALSMLYQVDGNYFMTLYSLLILLFAGCLSGDLWHGTRKGALAVMLPVLFFQFLIMTTTNWASFMGFTPFRLNKGSYNHVAENREYVTYERRAGQTWEILSASPEARVISFAEHPWSLVLPCVAQSVDDTFDTWGNPDVAYSVNTFLSYLRFQKTEYLYADPDYFLDETHRRQKMIFEGLKEKGILEYVTGDYAVLYRIKPE